MASGYKKPMGGTGKPGIKLKGDMHGKDKLKKMGNKGRI